MYLCMSLLASFPGRSYLQYLHNVSDQILEVGTAWERGYVIAALGERDIHHLQLLWLI